MTRHTIQWRFVLTNLISTGCYCWASCSDGHQTECDIECLSSKESCWWDSAFYRAYQVSILNDCADFNRCIVRNLLSQSIFAYLLLRRYKIANLIFFTRWLRHMPISGRAASELLIINNREVTMLYAVLPWPSISRQPLCSRSPQIAIVDELKTNQASLSLWLSLIARAIKKKRWCLLLNLTMCSWGGSTHWEWRCWRTCLTTIFVFFRLKERRKWRRTSAVCKKWSDTIMGRESRNSGCSNTCGERAQRNVVILTLPVELPSVARGVRKWHFYHTGGLLLEWLC